jgi:ABC-type multidrug transport system ATPase subunit
VSARHAELRRSGDRVELRDLGSKSGTRVDGHLVQRASIVAGARIGVGPYRLVFDGDQLVQADGDGGLRMDAEGLTVDAGDKRILNPTSLAIEPGEFVAIIGESGCGKSTLVKVLAGVSTPTQGVVRINGEPLHSLLSQVGYVPQDDIVHRALTVSEALTYAARLRLPEDSTEHEVSSTVARVLDELELRAHADTRIHSLSGGQRKRVGVGAELVHVPGLIFLDEPTSGLDPGLESHLMQLLRSLARGPRAVVAIVHATKNVGRCDKLAVMGRGGTLYFIGPPPDALRHFGVDDFDGIYATLARDPDPWRARIQPPPAQSPPVTAKPSGLLTPPRSGSSLAAMGRQTLILTSRYLRLFARDRRNLIILLGQAPVIALAIAVLFHTHVLARRGGDPPGAVQMLYLVELTVIWLGSIDASREIIKEKAVFLRERAVGVSNGAYVLSKWLVLFPLVVAQAGSVLAIVFALRPPGESIGALLAVLGTLSLTGFAAVALGLLVSSLVRTEDQATSLIPLLLIPQLLFAGAIVPLHKMHSLISGLAGFMTSRWSLASVGTTLDLNARFASRPGLAGITGYGTSFFSVSQALAHLILLGFLVTFTVALLLVLRRLSE